MIFNSFAFLVFLPIVFLSYWILFSSNKNTQNLFLVIASSIFYAWWDWRFLSILYFVAFNTFYFGRMIDLNNSNERRKNVLFSLSIIINLSLLAYFKYTNFFIQSFIDLWALFGLNLNINTLKIIVPIGISYYIFTSLSYVIDIYRQKIHRCDNILSYLSYVMFFPTLFCGPISRSIEQLPQYFQKREFNRSLATKGMQLILWGFFMKLCVADRLGIYVDTIYGNIDMHNGSSIFVATVFYAFQLYCDFGGYSLISIGIGNLFGIKLQENFRRPYFSTSFSEYWKRNHISLTQWLMDYVYYPLIGGSSSLRYWNFCMIITFLISGLWHGSSWTFVLWGLYQGFFIVLSTNMAKRRKRFEKKYNLKKSKTYLFITIIFVFLIVSFGLIFFRANSVDSAFTAYIKIFTDIDNIFLSKQVMVYGTVSLFILFVKDIFDEFYPDKKILFNNNNRIIRWVSYMSVLIYILLFGVLNNSSFIYFQF